jgi:hypothetical protein
LTSSVVAARAVSPASRRLPELLRPRVIHALGDAFAPAKFGD